MFIRELVIKGMPKRGAMVLIFVKQDGKSILQRVEALINRYWNTSLNIQSNITLNQIYCTKAFGIIDLDDDIIPFKPIVDDLRELTKNNLLEHARVLGKKFNNKPMLKDSMIKLFKGVVSDGVLLSLISLVLVVAY